MRPEWHSDTISFVLKLNSFHLVQKYWKYKSQKYQNYIKSNLKFVLADIYNSYCSSTINYHTRFAIDRLSVICTVSVYGTFVSRLPWLMSITRWDTWRQARFWRQAFEIKIIYHNNSWLRCFTRVVFAFIYVLERLIIWEYPMLSLSRQQIKLLSDFIKIVNNNISLTA